MVETHPLQAAVSFLLLLSAVIITLSAYQASAETVPEIALFSERVYYRGKTVRLAEAVVAKVDEEVKPPLRYLLSLMLRHAKEYLGYGAWTAAVYEASRAVRALKKLSRTTS